MRFLRRRSSLLRRGRLAGFVAPLRIHEFAVVAVGESVVGDVVPEKAGGGIVDIGLIVFERKFVGDGALEIIGSLFAAIGDLPGFFVVVAGDGGGGPEMAVAGNFSAVVEIVEHAELQRQLVLVGRDVGAIHGEGRIAVAGLQIAENLVVGAVFFDDVDHVLDGILAAGELDRSGIVVQQVVVLDDAV